VKFAKPQSIGSGGMSWTVVFQELNGDISHVLVSGGHDKTTAWRQAQSFFKQRVLALIPGNHQVFTKKQMS
tara:strand:- start:384 stop:596 length:213 start_codon:yes stop_codon:yes gene_type:complete